VDHLETTIRRSLTRSSVQPTDTKRFGTERSIRIDVAACAAVVEVVRGSCRLEAAARPDSWTEGMRWLRTRLPRAGFCVCRVCPTALSVAFRQYEPMTSDHVGYVPNGLLSRLVGSGCSRSSLSATMSSCVSTAPPRTCRF
jgi:hypothetical protein